jgi:hypothetical protein
VSYHRQGELLFPKNRPSRCNRCCPLQEQKQWRERHRCPGDAWAASQEPHVRSNSSPVYLRRSSSVHCLVSARSLDICHQLYDGDSLTGSNDAPSFSSGLEKPVARNGVNQSKKSLEIGLARRKWVRRAGEWQNGICHALGCKLWHNILSSKSGWCWLGVEETHGGRLLEHFQRDLCSKDLFLEGRGS